MPNDPRTCETFRKASGFESGETGDGAEPEGAQLSNARLAETRRIDVRCNLDHKGNYIKILKSL